MKIYTVKVTDRAGSNPEFVLRWGVAIYMYGRRNAVGSVGSNDRADAIRRAANEVRFRIRAEREWRRSKGEEELIAYARGAAQSDDPEYNDRCQAAARRELARRKVKR